MKRYSKAGLLILNSLIAGMAINALAQASQGSRKPPKEVVERLWSMAGRGELLTSAGWNRACGLFAHPVPFPANTDLVVVSNYYDVENVSATASTAEVVMDFEEAGRIDSMLRYTPPRASSASKSGIVYHLVLAPTRSTMFKADGKTIEKEMIGPKEWQITGELSPPWTTVNTAIRYVLEKRDKTTDLAIKANADRTIAKLMQLH